MFLVLDSKNSKIGPCAATYLPIAQTCPASCPLKGNGCYAESGRVSFTERRNRLPDVNGDTIAILEADEIRDNAHRVPRGWPLRLHVSGDAATPFRASTVAAAARTWRGPVWAYTHAWRDVPRVAWNGVSVLASGESLADARRALSEGYAPAVVVDRHPEDGRAHTTPDGLRVIPCPNQTRGVTCLDCRLCFDAESLRARNAVIAFEAHGSGKKRALTVVR